MSSTSRQVALTRLTMGLLSLLVHAACSSGDNGGVVGVAGGNTATGPGGSGPLGSGGIASNAIGGTGNGGTNSGFGGVTSSGGAAVSGGNGSGGVANGGTANAGGVSTTGGVALVGGSQSTGGARTTGGAAPIGGSTANTGGAKATGGNSATGGGSIGGVSSTGGAATGGTKSTGGATTGGAPSTGGAQAAGGVQAAGGSTHTGVWKVMPLGDSITGTTCYPQLTSQTLKNGGHTNFQFIGKNLNNQSCNGAPSLQTEGHGGYLVTYLTTNSPPVSGKGTLGELKTWAAEKPDIVLMHFGTNDCWSNIAPASILSAYVTVMTEFRAQNPAVIFFVSKIIPLAPSGCSSCPTNVTNLDAAITSAWATSNTTATSPVYIIDHWTGFNAATDTADGAHPNLTGAQKMATATYNALVAKNYF